MPVKKKIYLSKDINNLQAYPGNPKVHSEFEINRLAKYIKEVGYIASIIVDENDMVLSGHKRVLALMKNEQYQAEVIQVFGLTEREKRAYLIADNKFTEASKWDEDLLAEHVKILLDEDDSFSMMSIGFNDSEIDRINKIIDEKIDIEDEEPSNDDFNYKDPGEKNLDPSQKDILLIVKFESYEDQQELFLELRDRGFKVKV